ncbi:hypothetical protein [Algoriphagus hitonicola]|uniref:TolB-like 6-blade propeller-like n=1 Tax=Algoriphagus hitonicola TaxID=435880 RepID=A0A1I2XMX9_9BACT|nr:hypothetical protein [Algoriphagus hitonicola]SFH14868.1 hypothetical protein SAMN04487988_1213 [Algoriphagus hitonicola]
MAVFSCQVAEKDRQIQEVKKFTPKLIKEVTLDLSGGYPKLQGSPHFINDGDSAFLFIPSRDGIGVFSLDSGGKPVEEIKLAEIEGYFDEYSTDQIYFHPLSRNSFLMYHTASGVVSKVEDKEITDRFRVSDKLGDLFYLAYGGAFKSMDLRDDRFISIFGITERYGKPPYIYEKREPIIFTYDLKTEESSHSFPLPPSYEGKAVNVYDLFFISIAYDDTLQRYFINTPISDWLYFTEDFQTYDSVFLSPTEGFVDISNRENKGYSTWQKDFYLSNSFPCLHYDSENKLLVRQIRYAIESEQYDFLKENSYILLDEMNKNVLLFFDQDFEPVGRMDVSAFNHYYVHFGRAGMFILNDVEMIDEDHLTFSLFDF